MVAGCGSSGVRTLNLQLRSWTGSPPRINLRVVSKLAADDDRNQRQSEKWTRTCLDSLGRFSYIVDHSSPVQVVIEVEKVNDRKLARRRVTSSERGLVSYEDLESTDIKKLCPAAAQVGLNAYAAETLAMSAPPRQAAYAPPVLTAAPRAGAARSTDNDPEPEPAPQPEHGFDAAGGKRQLQAADAYLAAGDVPKALEHYLSAYEKLPLPLLLVKIGKCYRQLGRRGDAVKYFEQYVAIEPNGPESRDVREWARALKQR